MTNRQRTDLIEHYIREKKYADLRTLASKFGGSLSTARRALDQLEARGLVRRHHGGASLVETDATAQEYDFAVRDRQHPAEKHAIARFVADQIHDGMTVILDGGSTCYAVAQLLAGKRLQIVTNSLQVASLFSEIGNIETTVTGGTIFRRIGVLVGPLCEASFAQVQANIAVLGATGITDRGIWSHNALTASAQRAMIAAAERSVFVLDRSKFGRQAQNLITPFTKPLAIVTDRPPTPAVAKAIERAGVCLTLAGA